MNKAEIIKELERQYRENIKSGDYWYKVRFTTGAEFYDKAARIKETILMLMGE